MSEASDKNSGIPVPDWLQGAWSRLDQETATIAEKLERQGADTQDYKRGEAGRFSHLVQLGSANGP